MLRFESIVNLPPFLVRVAMGSQGMPSGAVGSFFFFLFFILLIFVVFISQTKFSSQSLSFLFYVPLLLYFSSEID